MLWTHRDPKHQDEGANSERQVLETVLEDIQESNYEFRGLTIKERAFLFVHVSIYLTISLLTHAANVNSGIFSSGLFGSKL